ncbi:HAD-IC family P-type ATPase [Sulfurimonas sp. C5]|uniref:cation-translocating P-type ATPase n=1 Tax=Sulfurimonas sp. C5 TaxID=3036947 RepID=UPI002453ADE4|nr:HAD-IC family P-type ATPase [Sulfurimonas sp. C5]MDH4943865.1 HAD-IC family P-type ATPase [Sulfurimonas sp. C5]
MHKKNQWHSMDINAVYASIESNEKGLSSIEAQSRLQLHGLNKLQEEKKQSALMRFILQFHNVLIYVLIFAAILTFFLGHTTDSIVIISVVLINAIIGFIQEHGAQNALESIRKMLAYTAVVFRDGQKQKCDSEELVVGDIIQLEAGDRVLADIRIIKAHGLSAEEAILTGESDTVEKTPESVGENVTIADRSSMVFAGTTIASGIGLGVVVETAKKTELGRINRMLSSVQTLTTPLVEQMDRFAKLLTYIILLFSVAILLIGHYLQNMPFNEIFIAVVSLFVAAIPEGLPAVVTITLAVGVQAMVKRNAIVRHLPAIETLGSVSVICSDKTGTLTQNKMMVETIQSTIMQYVVKGTGYDPTGAIYTSAGKEVDFNQDDFIKMMAKCSALCSDANLYNENGQWSIDGSPTEGALVAFSHKVGLDTSEIRTKYLRSDFIPFDSKHKFMATLNHSHEDESLSIIKGAAEIILSMCHYQYIDANNIEILNKTFWEQKAKDIATQGQRIIAIAYKNVPAEKTSLSFNDLENGLILVGFIGIIDPPRVEAVDAIKECYSASIEVKMITGDHTVTASAIGKAIGLRNSEIVMSGKDIEHLSDEELQKAVLTTNIFARTTPEHKLRLVKALQANNKIVAMTGDGVNDTPALKRSNVGIAMGKKGTEAAKESSEFVLMDDNFASIVHAVREGRKVYDNIKKVIGWTLPTSVSEASVIIMAILLGMAMPITPIQILWANMITVVTLGVALAFEKEDQNIMKRKPRAIDEAILNRTVIWQIVYVTILFLIAVFGIYTYSISSGAQIEYAQTLAFNTLIFMEIFYLFYVRNMNTLIKSIREIVDCPVVWTAVTIVVCAQIIVTYTPFFQNIFTTKSLLLSEILLILCVGFVMFFLLEVEKYIRLRVLGFTS